MDQQTEVVITTRVIKWILSSNVAF